MHAFACAAVDRSVDSSQCDCYTRLQTLSKAGRLKFSWPSLSSHKRRSLPLLLYKHTHLHTLIECVVNCMSLDQEHLFFTPPSSCSSSPPQAQSVAASFYSSEGEKSSPFSSLTRPSLFHSLSPFFLLLPWSSLVSPLTQDIRKYHHKAKTKIKYSSLTFHSGHSVKWLHLCFLPQSKCICSYCNVTAKKNTWKEKIGKSVTFFLSFSSSSPSFHLLI